MKFTGKTVAVLLGGAALLLTIVPAAAKTAPAISFNLPAQDLGDALRAVAARAGLQVYAEAGEVNGIPAPAIIGTMTPRAAIEQLLAGSGLTATFTQDSIVIRRRGLTASETAGDEIVVTGSYIRGAVPTGPVIRLSREAITEAGQVDLGEAIRSIPQNFAGGQNPGVGSGIGNGNENVSSASTINLRGLGQAATLTLLNGHRLPYDSAFNGVDVSAIPLAAIERIEIVTDGASAQYGSDAVAGVANVLLRRDFEGLTTSARLGGSTDGGNTQYHADAVGGTRWSGGGMLVAYDFTRNTAIKAAQRDYTATLLPETSLYPETRRHAVLVAAHQDLAPGVALRVDGLWSKRWSTSLAGTDLVRYDRYPRAETYAISPELEIAVGGDWTVTALGSFGRDRAHIDFRSIPVSGAASRTTGCFCNSGLSAEARVEGPLFTLGGGDARLAVGAGYRDNRLDYTQIINTNAPTAFDVSQDSYFAFGEIFLPFVGPAQEVPGVDRLSLSAALRYEDYPGMDRLATPRVGVVYAPIPGLSLKGSWSRSFKAPTLYQKYISYQTYLLPAAGYGVGGAGDAILYASGGNPNLSPERSRNWALGFEWAPPSIQALKLEASYFDVRYSDRIVSPIAGSLSGAFKDPGYASLLDLDPSAQSQSALIAGAQLGLQNFTSLLYDPARVVALVDNRSTNVAAQEIHGIDTHASWRASLGPKRAVSFDLAGSWLISRQRVTKALPSTQLSGIVFNPPKLRGRASAQFDAEQLRVAVFANYTGKLEDERFANPATLSATTTFDLTAGYDFLPGQADRSGLSVSLTINNVFNKKPPLIAQTGPTDLTYDSTNYSAIGRFVALGVSRSW
jgi:outer membrane receptor protein involved in Fe transport